MTILDQALWNAAPPSVRATAESCMVGASTAQCLLYFGPDHPTLANEYRVTWCGPRADAITVATNLETWL